MLSDLPCRAMACRIDCEIVGCGARRQAGRRLGEHQGEFITAEPRQQAGLAHGLADAFGDTDEQVVAGLVAESIIDLLESVEVEIEDACGPLARLLEALIESLDEGRAIEQARQRSWSAL